MKKTRFILLALVVALVLMGAGYAAWSQTFTISSTVSTGELFVKVSDEGITSVKVDTDGDGKYDKTVKENEAADYYLAYPKIETEGSTSEENGTLSKLTYTIEKLYPGVQVASKVRFENLGTIAVKTVGAAGEKSIIKNELWDELAIKVGVGDNPELKPVDGSGPAKLDNLAAEIASAVGDLSPDGDAVEVTIVQELPYDSTNEKVTNASQNQSVTWEVELTFEQYNAPAGSSD